MSFFNFQKPKTKEEKILFSITSFFKILVLIAFISSIVLNQWLVTLNSFLFLIFSLLPTFVEKNYNFRLPLELDLILILFLFATLILGEVSQFYEKFWWWDIMLHTISGFLIGLVGFLIVFSLRYSHKINLSPSLAVLFSFSFAMMIAGIWEIIEFLIDYFFRSTMQKSLIDTMTDLIVALFGAILISILGYVYMKKRKGGFFHRLLKKIVKLNFRKKKN